jgi:hypothetical protein
LGTVAKLAYRPRGPYEIVEDTGYGSYSVRPYGDPTAAVIKYATQALSPLPPAILPCTPIDTPDFRYLNHSHAPLPHPLRSPFNIQMHNNMWFSSSLRTDHPPLFKFTNIPDPDSPLSVPPPASIPADAAISVFQMTTRLFLSPWLLLLLFTLPLSPLLIVSFLFPTDPLTHFDPVGISFTLTFLDLFVTLLPASVFGFFGPTVEKSLLIGASNVLTVSLPMVLLLLTVSLSSLGPSAALSTSFMSIFGNPVKLRITMVKPTS